VAIAEAHQPMVSTDPYFLTTQFKIIESYRILTNVIANLHLDEKLAHQNGSTTPWSIDETFDFLSHRISVEQTRMTSLIEISVRNQTPETAALIANGVADSYKQFRLEQWRNSRGRGIDALAEKQRSMTNELQEAQNKLDDLRNQLEIVDMYDQSVISLDLLSKRLEDWDHQRVLAEADYLEYSNVLFNLHALSTNQLGGALPTANPHQTDPELNDLAANLRYAKEKMVEVKQSYGPDMPVYKSVKKQLEDCEASYQNKIDAVMAGIDTRVKEDEGFLQLIQQEEQKITDEKNLQAKKDRPYYNAKADVELQRHNSDQLATLLIREMAELGQPNDNVVIVCNPARPDKIPVWPKTMLIIPLGVIVGLMVGLGLAFFIEYLDTSVKTIDDVERSLQAPVLGVIPQNVGLILDEGAESPHAEAYRVLRTNLLFSRKNESWNTVSVLSGGAGEGKSTTLFNLATVFAQNGQRILVVDSDLRRPTLHKVLHVSNTVGLTDFLLKQRSLEEVIQKTKVPTLDFMASGKLPSSSMSILGSAQMKETIQELKRRYEFIFFDSPPLLGVSDASILASEMDMVLQVIQYRRYPQPMTLRAKQMILKVGGNLIGIVLNNINMSQDENYYYYSGYYEYQSHAKDESGVQVSDPSKTANVEIKPKY
jgi:capsular exopolysaccharide synthesis family protein